MTLLGAYILSYMGSHIKGNGPVQVLTNTNRQIRVLPPKTAKEILNVAFVSSDSTSSTNEVNTAYVFLLLLTITHKRNALHHTLMTSCTLSIECKSKGTQDSRRRDAENTGYKARDNGKRLAKQDEYKAMVTIDRECVDWTEDSHVNDIFAKVKGMHAVPHMPGNYMPPKSNFGIDESKFTYGPEKSTTTKSDAKTSNSAFCESNYSVETLESVPKLVANKPKAVGEPKVWFDAPIIEEYESDSDDEHVTIPLKEQEKPIFAFVNTVKHVKTPRQTVKEQNACSQNPKPNKRDWNGLMSKIWVWDIGLLKRHALCVVVLVILLEIMTFMRKEWLNRLN
nr:hypothetical protein [Tanacetum cinerariifolium]